VKTLGLPLIAVLLVAGVLGVQIAAGGGDYVPRQPADPCQPRPVPPIQAQMEAVAERLVLLGLDNAACRLGVSREGLVLSLAESQRVDPRTPAAIKAGLHQAVDRLDREGRLPRVSQVLPEALDQADLPPIAKTVIGALPDGVIDSALPTGALLQRAVGELDVNQLLQNLDDPDQLESAVRKAILQAARDEIVDRLRP
jgi:hypothetical protein